MILSHHGKSPRIDPTAYVAPNAVVCGDEKIGAAQKPLNFPLTVHGYDRDEATMEKIARRMAEMLGVHPEDEAL